MDHAHTYRFIQREKERPRTSHLISHWHIGNWDTQRKQENERERKLWERIFI